MSDQIKINYLADVDIYNHQIALDYVFGSILILVGIVLFFIAPFVKKFKPKVSYFLSWLIACYPVPLFLLIYSIISIIISATVSLGIQDCGFYGDRCKDESMVYLARNIILLGFIAVFVFSVLFSIKYTKKHRSKINDRLIKTHPFYWVLVGLTFLLLIFLITNRFLQEDIYYRDYYKQQQLEEQIKETKIVEGLYQLKR